MPTTTDVPTPTDVPNQAAMPTTVRRPRAASRSAVPDATLVAALDLARDAAREVAEADTVGPHLNVVSEAERVVTHSFVCTSPSYRGWRWAVTLARGPRSRIATVSEVHLLPGADSIQAPQWLPWVDRIAPGDLSPGDVLPARLDDPLLEQGFEATGEQDVDAAAQWELGLGRPRVLSAQGRAEAAQRWYEGEHGPHGAHAEQAPARCTTCGYFVPMAGALRQVFGVCASEWSPSDGKVVSLDHGCGAHSEMDVERRPEQIDPPVLDELGYEAVDVERPAGPTTDHGESTDGGVDGGVDGGTVQ